MEPGEKTPRAHRALVCELRDAGWPTWRLAAMLGVTRSTVRSWSARRRAQILKRYGAMTMAERRGELELIYLAWEEAGRPKPFWDFEADFRREHRASDGETPGPTPLERVAETEGDDNA